MWVRWEGLLVPMVSGAHSASTVPLCGELSGLLCGDQAGLNPSRKGELDEPLPLSREEICYQGHTQWHGVGTASKVRQPEIVLKNIIEDAALCL